MLQSIKVDPVSGLTPIEIAVKAENHSALKAILSVAARSKQPLAIGMALNHAKRNNDALALELLLASNVEDDNL